MPTPKKEAPKQLKIEIPNDLHPSYANFAIINHSYNEIVLDLAHIAPNMPQVRVQTRVVMTPYHAKMLLNALATNIRNYENRFGEIKMKGSGIPERHPMGAGSQQVH